MADKYWVGGTGTWDGGTLDVGHWVTTSGGSTVTAAPIQGDNANFNELSGGGTVTVMGDHSCDQILAGQFTNGVLDYTARQNTTRLYNGGFNMSGNQTRNIKLGSSIFITDNINFGANSLLTYDTGTSVFQFMNALGVTSGGGGAGSLPQNGHNKFVIGPTGSATSAISFTVSSFYVNEVEFDLTNVGVQMNVGFSAIMNMNNSFWWKGRPNRPITVCSFTTPGTISLGAGKTGIIEWAHIYDLTFTGGGTFIAKNCLNGGGNTGITFVSSQTAAIGGR